MVEMPLKLAFLDTTFADYTPRTAIAAPLGGTQSAAGYLAVALARAGADVTLINGTSSPGWVDGVMCRHHETMPVSLLARHDVLIIMGGCDSEGLRQLRTAMTVGQKLVLWTQHASDQPGVGNLAEPKVVALWDAFFFVSRWQREEFIRRFRLPRWRCHILRNAPAPCFGGLFVSDADIVAAKPWPPVLAYTSTPFRGLSVLLASMPRIRAAIPGTMLRVFSSLEAYQVPLDRDPYVWLYKQCRQTDGVDYVGGLAQPALAAALRDVTALAYANRYAETSCISVMEAQAAGCLIVSSRLGALPETAGGLARLLPVPDDPTDHAARFADAMVDELTRRRADATATNRLLHAQRSLANAANGWDVRAAQWLSLLNSAAAFAAPLTGIPALLVRLRQPSLVGDNDAMADLCEQVLSLDPAHAGTWRLLMQVQAAQARPTDALLSLGRALRLDARVPSAEWHDWMPILLPGLAREGAQPLSRRVAALSSLCPLLAGGPFAAVLAATLWDLVVEAEVAGDPAVMLLACLRLADLSPRDARLRLAAASACARLGDHIGMLEMAGAALRLDSSAILSVRHTRSVLTGWLDTAEQAALAGPGPRDVRLFTAMAVVAGALGEDASFARRAAASDDPRLRRAMLLRIVANRHRVQGRRTEQVEALRQAADLAVEPDAVLRLCEARTALAQRLLLENLRVLLNDGANGLLGVQWQGAATCLINQIEQSLYLDQNDEGERSYIWGSLRGCDAFLAWFNATRPQAPPLPDPPSSGRKIYDCFQFFNELDLLDLRLAELSSVVDHFVLVEASFTHTGAPKPLYYEQNRDRFAAYADKIIHIVVDDDPGGFAWVREAHQRHAILRGLIAADPADMVVISDVDEILRPSIMRQLRACPADSPALFAPHLDIYLYFLNLRSADPWVSVAAAPCDFVRRVGANNMRYLAKQGIGQVLHDAGWHFTWMGGMERFLTKLDAFAHREMMASFGHAEADNRALLESFFATGRFEAGAVPGMWTDLTRVPIDDSFPVALRARLADFSRMGWIAPERVSDIQVKKS